jgi:alpha-amylase
MKEFSPVDWAHHTNIYEVNVRQYTPEGTLPAFEKSLPRLKNMGVHTLWFMPLTPISAMKKKGTLGSYYACSDYCAVNPEFGTLVDFRNLVIAAHDAGLKVIIDWVANHTGWDHVWTKTNPDYYKRKPVGATSSTREEGAGAFLSPEGMDDIIALNYDNDELQEAMISAMEFWVNRFDIDGFRCDLAAWVRLDFWKRARKKLDAVKPLFWLGEFDELDEPRYAEVFDASYTWKWMHATAAYYKNEMALPELIAILKKYDDLGDYCMRSWFTSNHDENSWNGTEFEKYGLMAEPLAVFSATWNGIPLIYSGQEIPNRKRLAFFDKDPIQWPGLNRNAEWYTILLHLHANHPALRAADPEVRTHILKTNEKEKVFAFLRYSPARELLVILNFCAEDLEINITDPVLKGKFKELVSGSVLDTEADSSFKLKSWGWLVLDCVRP